MEPNKLGFCFLSCFLLDQREPVLDESCCHDGKRLIVFFFGLLRKNDSVSTSVVFEKNVFVPSPMRPKTEGPSEFAAARFL